MKSLFLILAVMGLVRHDFHVSITNAEWNSETESLQITMKLFTDDLEAALKENFKPEPNLGEPDEYERADSLIFEYLQRHFWLENEGEKLDYLFIGKEIEQDIVFVYLEVTDMPAVNELSVSNTVFFDRFDDQSNIVNIEIRDKLQSAFLEKGKPAKNLKFD